MVKTERRKNGHTKEEVKTTIQEIIRKENIKKVSFADKYVSEISEDCFSLLQRELHGIAKVLKTDNFSI